MEANVDNCVVLIPAYNEVKTIGGIVHNVVYMGFNVLVIDDGSSDGTENEALENGAMVIKNSENLGKGASIKKGLKYVFDTMKYEWMIIMDSDGQHHPEDITSFINAAKAADCDIVVGNRMSHARTMPQLRYWTNIFTSWAVSLFCGQKIPDSQCGFRLIKVSSVGKLNLVTKRYDTESEMLIEAARNKLKIISAPVRTIYGDEDSQIHPVRDTIRFFSLIFKSFFPKK